jgi:3-deoxy-D-manno-octulosonic-acid transferase
MHLLYSFALLALFLALLPYFIYQALKHGKYLDSFRQRLGRLPDGLRDDRPTLWVHAVSVGEFNAARPLVASLRRQAPEYRVVVSTTTLTGQRLARAECGRSIDGSFYFPFDLARVARRALDHIRPAAVVILETELWPNFLRECRKRNVLTVIANGRISPRSFRGYRRARPFITRVIQDVSLFVMQSEADAKRARALGAPPDRVRVCGNLKYDIAEADGKRSEAGEIDSLFALSSSQRLIVAGSTAAGEEKILLDTLADVRSRTGLEDARLLIAPRHPERFDEVEALITQSGFEFVRRSRATDESQKTRAASVILLDTIGELASVYQFAAVVFVGGSLAPRGGHNVIEPAAYAKPIIVGPFTENFSRIISDFISRSALVQISEAEARDPKALAREVIRLLTDRTYAEAMGARAREILLDNRGATRCTVAAITERMKDE